MKTLAILFSAILITSGAHGANVSARGIAARAGTTTKTVINAGTKVATATQNSVVDTECQTKFDSCMDMFCMTDNADGGRCACNAQYAGLSKQLVEIQSQETQSYKLATAGVEMIESGATTQPQINQRRVGNSLVD